MGGGEKKAASDGGEKKTASDGGASRFVRKRVSRAAKGHRVAKRDLAETAASVEGQRWGLACDGLFLRGAC